MVQDDRAATTPKSLEIVCASPASQSLVDAANQDNPIEPAGLPPYMSAMVWSQAQALAKDESAIVQCPGDPSA